jgi:hypothetical protein
MDRSARCHQALFSALPTLPNHSRLEKTRKMSSIRVGDHEVTYVSNFVRGKSGKHRDFAAELFEYL